MRLKSNSGFTLLELVIVLSIVSIIASAAVSTFVDIANRAFDVQEDATMRSLQNGALLFFAENGRWWGVNGTENPFDLLENPPPHYVGPAGDPGRILNVHWMVFCATCGAPNGLWQIWCPHVSVTGFLRGQAWFFWPVGGGITIGTDLPH